MPDIIRLLPDSVANQIAAGEVIQRPASVVKELVENAVDAGATDIRIFIRDAGRTLIQVVDNGKGMSEMDARMAFERHATSKISAASDLFTLRTMGFRGEALPSICAISEVELRTRTADTQIGTRLVINGSRVETQEACVCEPGSCFMVKNLFFNVPARRKFLKSENVELSNIMREFERLALVNCGIRMQIDTGTRVIDLRPGSFKQRIGDIWKNNLNMQLIPVDVETSLIRIHGFVSRPEYARRRNPLQYFIVNGRNMRHPYFHKAVMSCYESLIAADTQPCYFMRFEVDPDTIDVNIHPTKSEIKFEHEQQIWPIIQAAVKAALGKFSAVPSIDFNTEILPVEAMPEDGGPAAPDMDIPADYNPFVVEPLYPPLSGGGGTGITGNGSGFTGVGSGFSDVGNFSGGAGRGGNGGGWRRPERVGDWQSLYDNFMNNDRRKHPFAAHNSGEATETESESQEGLSTGEGAGQGASDRIPGMEGAGLAPVCMQVGLRYIVTSSEGGLLVIDQHRAHVRVLYEQYLKAAKETAQVSQRVMFPESIELDPAHQAALEAVDGELARLGFILEYEEETRWRIAGIPMMLKGADPKETVVRILDSVCEDSVNYGKEASTADTLLGRVALLMARAAAITAGRRLTAEEMEQLVGNLFSLPDPAYTPSGNPVYRYYDATWLSRAFT